LGAVAIGYGIERAQPRDPGPVGDQLVRR